MTAVAFGRKVARELREGDEILTNGGTPTRLVSAHTSEGVTNLTYRNEHDGAYVRFGVAAEWSIRVPADGPIDELRGAQS